MNPTEPRLHVALEAAMNQIRATAASVAARVCETLGATAAACNRISERDTIIATQQELRRNAGTFQSAFHEALREKVKQELAPRPEARRKLASADWQTLSLVEDREVEERMNFERIGQMISHECEWQLRDLAAYMGALTGLGRADEDKNPLRADVLGAALYRGIEAVTENPDGRKILTRDLGQAMAHAMPECYAEILRGLQQRGIQPVVLTVRTFEGPGNQLPGLNSAYASLPAGERNSTRSGHGDLAPASGPGSDIDLMYEHRRAAAAAAAAAAPSTLGYSRGGTGPGTHRGGPHDAHSSYAHADTTHAEGRGGSRSHLTSPADAQLMNLLRRLTAVASGSAEFNPVPAERSYSGSGGYGSRHGGPGDSGASHHGSHSGSDPGSRGGVADFIRTGQRSARDAGTGPASAGGGQAGAPFNDGLTGMMAVNLIRAHREELLQASTGKLDHMVIDVVGSLFDQILSDSRVPPQMARQIARLQLPVLRVALNDQTFFSTRRHPVRRFINRIASLACAFDEFDEGPGKPFLARVAQLVQEIVEGDFDQIDLYAAKLAELERFIAEQTEGEVEQSGAVTTLASKESELRIQQRYMQQLQAALGALSLPAYLNDFLAQVWSQALVLATRRDGAESDRAKRFRRVGRDIVMSVQPKGSPMFRKKFLMQLPPLMKDLNEGMQLIGWPEAAQRDFFSKLLPAHAESLKGQPLSELDHNLMVKQLEGIFGMAIPGIESVSLAEPLPEAEEATLERRFTPEEAKQVGLVPESAVNWDGGVDIDLGAPDEAAESTTSAAPVSGDPDAPLGPTTTESGEPAEPSRGAQLIEHVKLGFAYQMHLKDEWQKVRLAHVSTGRSFFVFTRGAKHQETISMTSRMLARMCETGRMRAVESAYLMERAT
ncbi:MAG: DUF1631 family protein, partial [Caldimonas sp.]